MPQILPPDCQDAVRRVSGWLQDARSKLDRHEAEFGRRFPSEPIAKPQPPDALADHLRELPKKLEPLDAIAAAADGDAQQAEIALRDLAGSSETLRRRLAEGVGRAIR